jgi:hypothetical protein
VPVVIFHTEAEELLRIEDKTPSEMKMGPRQATAV